MTERALLPDPTDLDGLRRRLAEGDSSRRHPIGMGRIRIGTDALSALPGDVASVRRDGPVVVLVDETPMTRRGEDLKSTVAAMLHEAHVPSRLVVIRAHADELHADADALAQADAAIADAGCVVSVGSGTITDIAKDASRRAGVLPFVVVQTAVSVNAFSDDMAVLLRDGVKRTVPSRWPDVLIVDLDVIAEAPAAMNRAGFGELCSMFTAPADWYLATAVGMDTSYDPAVVALFREGAEGLLAGAERVRANDPMMLAELAGRMTLTGIAMGVAGRTAPLSGTEHLLSHMLDMAAAAAGRRIAFHGAQVGVAGVLAATVWDDTLERFDPRRLIDDRAFPAPEAVERRVRQAFDAVDATGRMADECWRDVGAKLERWHAARPAVAAFAADWGRHRDAIRTLVAGSATLRAALAAAGAPADIDEIDPPAPPDVVRWAVRSLPLMRDRFTVADLLSFAGDWEDGAVARLVDRSGILAGAR